MSYESMINSRNSGCMRMSGRITRAMFLSCQQQQNVKQERGVITSQVSQSIRNHPGKWLTVSNRGRLSLTAPTHPRQPITMMMVPTAMSRLAADSEGRDDDRVAKFPWVTESQTPTPSMPHPPNCRGNTKRCEAVRGLKTQSQTHSWTWWGIQTCAFLLWLLLCLNSVPVEACKYWRGKTLVKNKLQRKRRRATWASQRILFVVYIWEMCLFASLQWVSEKINTTSMSCNKWSHCLRDTQSKYWTKVTSNHLEYDIIQRYNLRHVVCFCDACSLHKGISGLAPPPLKR